VIFIARVSKGSYAPDIVEKVRPTANQTPATEIRFLRKAFTGIGIRDRSPAGTIFYTSVLLGLVADFFNNIRLHADIHLLWRRFRKLT